MNKSLKQQCVQTAGITINPELGQISSAEDSAKLPPVNFNVLWTLVNSNGNVISRKAIFKSVWPNQEVSDDALTRCISDLRKLLAAFCNEPLIETLPKRGYRWLASVEQVEFEKEEPESRSKAIISSESPEITDSAKLVKWLVMSVLISSLVTAAVIISVTNIVAAPDAARIVILEHSPNPTPQPLKIDILRILKKVIIDSPHFQLVAKQEVLSKLQIYTLNTKSYYPIDWALEYELTSVNGQQKLIVNMVDVKTGLVQMSNEYLLDRTKLDTGMLKKSIAQDLAQSTLRLSH